ncbi:universal stress protein [Streptomyces olivoreticuli]|uniref:universal stress protein n=1 Tax=Streptomyces olivoreticuli TaxID=68246 RepID=UPI00265A990F|nr:universal stress protein [Streptomyces olivoreticuli]WKK23809.1 universal stress protein [Streptomyces olivoreticuli]
MQNSVRRVVVGVDGSAGSIAALRQAAGEARRHHAELRPVLVYSSPQGDYIDMMWPPDPEMARELAHQAHDDLMCACERAGGLPDDVPCDPVVARGQVGPLLVEAAAENGDLLVVGGGSQSAVHRFLMGSVSRYCLRHAPGPVLVIPPEDSVGHGPEETAAPAASTGSPDDSTAPRGAWLKRAWSDGPLHSVHHL